MYEARYYEFYVIYNSLFQHENWYLNLDFSLFCAFVQNLCVCMALIHAEIMPNQDKLQTNEKTCIKTVDEQCKKKFSLENSINYRTCSNLSWEQIRENMLVIKHWENTGNIWYEVLNCKLISRYLEMFVPSMVNWKNMSRISVFYHKIRETILLQKYISSNENIFWHICKFKNTFTSYKYIIT